ncbi:MAG: GNAT family N-acetyltransferase [Rhodopirellula sp.]|nr:GNAT family N-acetyltransferase [Rhodopirellula sp.]
MGTDRNDLTIHTVSIEQVESVLQLAFQSLPSEQQEEQLRAAADDLRSGAASLDAFLEARRGTRRVGAVYGQVQPGRSAVLWLPGLVRGETVQTADRLLAAALDRVSRSRVRIAQVALEQVGPSDDALLRAHGFTFLADLLYLVSLEVEFPHRRPSSPLEFFPYCEREHDRFARLVETTYQNTRDCPGLDGIRSIEDVLAGYRGSPSFNPSHWLTVRCHGRDVGCLLLTDYPKQGNMELVYMGLVVAVRGSGWGSEIVRHAQWAARRAGRPRLVLAVDSANEPALQVYTACGFQAWDRRTVYLKVFSDPTAG